jgi:hypothetical protein
MFIIVCLGVIGWSFAVFLFLFDIRRQLDAVRPPVATLEPAQLLPRPDELGLIQCRLLHILYGEYPRSLGLRTVAGPLGLQYPAAERLCERLASIKLIAATPGGYNAPGVFLTKAGRDYCLENGLDRGP